MFRDIPILCVDDDVDSLELTMLWLKMNGCEAMSALSGAEALKLLEKEKFELCIVDYKLPDCTGIELCKKARRKWPTMQFILNSADIRLTVQAEAATAGMHFISKPTDLDLLHRLVDSIVHCSTNQPA